jgi:hypothetical protein
MISGEGIEILVTRPVGKINGKRQVDRRDGVCRWLGVKDHKDISRDARDRSRWRNISSTLS